MLTSLIIIILNILSIKLNYFLSNFWRSFEMPLINCKIELKLNQTKYCVLSAAGTYNRDANPNNIILIIKDTKLYVPVAILSAKDNQKLSKLLSKGFERSVYLNEHKMKSETKIQHIKQIFSRIKLC